MKNYANSFKNLHNTKMSEMTSLMNAHRNLDIKVKKLRKQLESAENGVRRGFSARKMSVNAIKKSIDITRKNMKSIAKKWRNVNKKARKVEKSLIIRMAKNLSSPSKK